MANPLGVYICGGCGIGEAIDTAKLNKSAKVHPMLCGTEGLEMIRSEGAAKIVIAACSGRFKTEAFAFEHERVNLRELVAWCHEPNDEETQALAEDYVAMGIAKAQKTNAPQPLADEVSKRLLILGSDAAAEAATGAARDAGYETVCLESAARIDGQPGQFDVSFDSQSARVGAIVLATGSRPYDPEKLAHLGYGLTGVITPDRITEARGDVLFIQCAGSRDAGHLPYCSAVCCTRTLEQAAEIRKQRPDSKVYIIYKDMRTPGKHERLYRAAQDDALTFLTKGEVAGVQQSNGRLAVTVKNSLLGEEIALEADTVVLATGMVPNAAGALNLSYRQGPDLPEHRYGFPDSHFVCFPYETRRTGIYAAGTVRAPMDEEQAREDGIGAAMKAIQCVEMASRGETVHPRAGDLTSPSFFLQRCTQCKRCTEECPFGTLDEDAKGTPKPNPYRCRRCGICMGACPERIISFSNYSVDIISSMIKAIEVPEEDEEKPRVVIFMCENDALPALDIAGAKRMKYDPSARVIPLRCLGSMNIVWIADALSRGVDGVMLVGCKYGDEYQCHFVKGSELANRRLENVKETLDRLQLERERLEVVQLSIDEYGKLPGIIDAFVQKMRDIGPNPYKGF